MCYLILRNPRAVTQKDPPAAPTPATPSQARAWLYVQKFCGSLVVLLAIACCQPQRARGQTTSVIDREYALKAAYLYNFGTYVEWPEAAFAGPAAPLVIGVVGEAPFGGVLDQLKRRKIKSRSVTVRRLGVSDAVDDCHILFLAASLSGDQQRRILVNTRGLPILCVGETKGFTRQGGDIGFFLQQNKLRFEINVQAARQQGLKVSSKLLGVATIVDTEHELTNESSRSIP